MNNQDISEKIQILVNQYNAKNYELVITKSKQLIKKNPQHEILYNLMGSSYQNIGEFINAKNIFKDGLKLNPNSISLMNNLAMTYKNLLEFEVSENLYLKILERKKTYLNAYVNLGNLKRDLNKFDDAIKLYEKALKITDSNTVVNYSLALAYQGLGKFEEAVKFAKRTLKIEPKFTRADHLISQSIKYKNKNEHYSSLIQKIEDKSLLDLEKIDLYFALSKAEEDLGNFKEATFNMIKGNELKKKSINYSINNEIYLFEDIKDAFKNSKYEINQDKNEDNIIFILGMPRSGTSLVEQIISTHSEVFGAGELPILSKIIKNHFINNERINSKKISKFIDKSINIEILRKEYMTFIGNFNYKEKFIIDKAPLNFRWIGFIKILFPNSKIIHCSRGPKNNCLSMYKNLFEGGLGFTYDQNDLVKYYKNYSDLMGFWESLYKDSIYEVKYENLISDNIQEIKNIIKFCNLNWEEECLNFHKNNSPIKTMSTAQARKPIYQTSVNSFEKYKEYLKIIEKSF